MEVFSMSLWRGPKGNLQSSKNRMQHKFGWLSGWQHYFETAWNLKNCFERVSHATCEHREARHFTLFKTIASLKRSLLQIKILQTRLITKEWNVRGQWTTDPNDCLQWCRVELTPFMSIWMLFEDVQFTEMHPVERCVPSTLSCILLIVDEFE